VIEYKKVVYYRTPASNAMRGRVLPTPSRAWEVSLKSAVSRATSALGNLCSVLRAQDKRHLTFFGRPCYGMFNVCGMSITLRPARGNNIIVYSTSMSRTHKNKQLDLLQSQSTKYVATTCLLEGSPFGAQSRIENLCTDIMPQLFRISPDFTFPGFSPCPCHVEHFHISAGHYLDRCSLC
jgi:hypothetical protein